MIISLSEPKTPLEDDPRDVLRGLKLPKGVIGLDSLYLIIEYPAVKMYHFWRQGVLDTHDPRLFEGIPYHDRLLRKGAVGYKLSVWEGDARAFLTDRVSEMLPEGEKGMGVMLQLGPQWLRQYADLKDAEQLRANIYTQLERFGMMNASAFPARLNRMDMALDVVGWYTGQFSMDEWLAGWVGYAKPRHMHLSKITGELEGLSVGSYHGGVRFKFYNKLSESRAQGTERFWRQVWDIPANERWPVTRFEWSFKPYQAKFTALQYLTDYSFERLVELVNYGATKWGRLCTPNPDDPNTARWELTYLWKTLLEYIDDWAEHYQGIAKRVYEVKPELSEAYLQSMVGWISGLQARIGIEQELDRAVALETAMHYLLNQVISKGELQMKADTKHEVMQILMGRKA